VIQKGECSKFLHTLTMQGFSGIQKIVTILLLCEGEKVGVSNLNESRKHGTAAAVGAPESEA
jgi:hypothetical protein